VVGLVTERVGAFEEIGGWPRLIGRLVSRESLSVAEASLACAEILSGHATPAQIAGYAVALRSKGETVDEMVGMLEAMYEFAEVVEVPPSELDGPIVDTCGTGGDGSHSINVSTIAAFIVAGAGATVCKHGGRAASSSAGSADVLESLGVAIDLGPEGVLRCMQEARMGFCFAPRFHPAMRNAAPVRRELGVPTIFNYLGPLANPCHVRRQVIGVNDALMAPKMIGVLGRTNCQRAMVVHGDDGLDEITTTTRTTVTDLAVSVGVEGQATKMVRTWSLDPGELGIPTADLVSLAGGDAFGNAQILRKVLEGEEGAPRDIAVLNAAAGIVVAGLAENLLTGIAMARDAIDSGKALLVLDRLISVSQQLAPVSSTRNQGSE
jgi:anthranilate phosphoribosyltransferase